MAKEKDDDDLPSLEEIETAVGFLTKSLKVVLVHARRPFAKKKVSKAWKHIVAEGAPSKKIVREALDAAKKAKLSKHQTEQLIRAAAAVWPDDSDFAEGLSKLESRAVIVSHRTAYGVFGKRPAAKKAAAKKPAKKAAKKVAKKAAKKAARKPAKKAAKKAR